MPAVLWKILRTSLPAGGCFLLALLVFHPPQAAAASRSASRSASHTLPPHHRRPGRHLRRREHRYRRE